MGTVKVEALQYHTTAGVAYQPGEVYDIDPELVDTVIVQGKARRAAPGDAAARVAEVAAPAHPVTPMTTTTTAATRTTRGPVVAAVKKK